MCYSIRALLLVLHLLSRLESHKDIRGPSKLPGGEKRALAANGLLWSLFPVFRTICVAHQAATDESESRPQPLEVTVKHKIFQVNKGAKKVVLKPQ